VQVVRCPRCGQENRGAVSVTLCSRCGCDLSLLAGPGDLDAGARRVAEPDEYAIEEFVPQPEELPPPAAAAPERPAAPGALDVVARTILAVSAIALGLGGGLIVGAGSALAGDPQIAGSVVILAAAAGLSGLVMVLIGGSDRSPRSSLGLRAVGFLLAAVGVWAATTLAGGPIREALQEQAAAETPAPAPQGSPMMPGGMMMPPPGSGMVMPGGPTTSGEDPSVQEGNPPVGRETATSGADTETRNGSGFGVSPRNGSGAQRVRR
jgi:hypothetical protein